MNSRHTCYIGSRRNEKKTKNSAEKEIIVTRGIVNNDNGEFLPGLDSISGMLIRVCHICTQILDWCVNARAAFSLIAL